VVLAVNSSGRKDLDRERLYVGMSRATDQLVVCGDRDYLEQIGGPALLRRLQE
jgi:ATP-dependent exoDNAse (exonuclease V) alpha subunit